ncbi:MAG: C10 family peptidase [Bacteroidales bacterium]
MKRLILCLLVVVNSVQGYSKGIDIEKAKLVAERFLETTSKTDITINEAVVFQSNELSLTYVINFKPEGWAIVSADDRVQAILGFSYTGYFDTKKIESLPFYFWFEGYADQISSLISSKAPEIEHPSWDEIETLKYTKAVDPVEPLIQVEWNQGSGWNAYCPVDVDGPGGHAYAGCVAVAMAQCMSVYQHPTQGYGSHSYTDETYGTQSANFGETTYDWANMENTGATDAVALLLYHLGISVNMGYGADGSGAFSTSVPGAIKSYFEYSNSAQYISRSDFTVEGEWEGILIEQLQKGYPIYYSGDAGDGQSGHAFNIDGVNSNGAFHFNFGWSGSYNGYYFVTSITPGSNDFTSDQAAVINFVPRDNSPQDIALSNNTVEEGMPIGTVVGEIIVTDETPDDTFTYEVSSPFGSVPFTEQDGNLVTSVVLDYNNIKRYEVIIKATDKTNLSVEKNIFVNVDENVAPTNITITKSVFNDTVAIGAFIGKLKTIDLDALDIFTYAFETNINPLIGADNNKFEIKNDSLVTNYDFSNYDQNTCSIFVKSSDKKGEFITKEFIITINKSTGIFNPKTDNKLVVYPNPSSSGDFIIKFPERITYKKINIQIYTMEGILKQSFAINADQHEFPLKINEPGMYFVKLLINNDIYNSLIIYK